MFDGFFKRVPAAASAQALAELEQLRERCAKQERALDAIGRLCSRLREGDLEARIADWDRYEEHAPTITALNHVLDLTDAFVREAVASLQATQEKRFYRQVLRNGLVGRFGSAAEHLNAAIAATAGLQDKAQRQKSETVTQFDASMSATIETLTQTVATIQDYGGALTGQAGQTREKALSVAGAAEEATSNVQTVAAASEQLSASVEEIARQVALSSDQAQQAADQAAGAAKTISELRQASDAISDVVALIRDVAERTNLLALNATIEAARAGEAGRGFAVVAGEVKALATQTARATEDISRQVTRMQNETRESVQAVTGIADLMDNLRKISTTIASATEEQASSTQEISRNIQEAAQGTQSVSADIAEVNANADQTLAQVTELAELAGQMAQRAGHLKAQSERFKQSVLEMD
ncbi:MAG: methyl-accepting chemotaxis protein [Rhodothalassiaceae bacterium]